MNKKHLHIFLYLLCPMVAASQMGSPPLPLSTTKESIISFYLPITELEIANEHFEVQVIRNTIKIKALAPIHNPTPLQVVLQDKSRHIVYLLVDEEKNQPFYEIKKQKKVTQAPTLHQRLYQLITMPSNYWKKMELKGKKKIVVDLIIEDENHRYVRMLLHKIRINHIKFPGEKITFTTSTTHRGNTYLFVSAPPKKPIQVYYKEKKILNI